MLVCLFLKVLSGSLYAPMLQGRVRNHQHLWNLLNDLTQSTNTWGRMDLNGEGFFFFHPNSQPLYQSLGFLLLEYSCFQVGFPRLNFYVVIGLTVITIHVPFQPPHSETALFSSFKTSKEDFPGGAVDKNLPANAGDVGWIPGSGRFHMPKSD